jgi:hypothetical protein
LIASLLRSFEDMVYGWIVAGLGFIVLVVQLVVLVIASRRARRADAAPLPLKVHGVAGATIAAFLIAVGVSVHAARALMFQVFFGNLTDPSEKAVLLSRGMSGQMNAIPFAVSVTLAAALMWLVGMVQTLRASKSDRGARGLPPVVLVSFGLLPVAVGALRWCTGMITSFAGMAGLPPEMKEVIIDRALEAARVELARFATISMVAIPFLAVAAVVLIVVRGHSAGDAPRAAPARSARPPLVISAAALALAAALFLGVRSTVAENELPWPPTTGSQLAFPGGPTTPDLIGPDAPERAPVVALFGDRLMLDAFATPDFEDLEDKLRTLRNNFKLLNPGGDFNEMALLQVDAAAPIPRVKSMLRAVRGAWYYRPLFAFTKTETHVRPVFGKLERDVVTGARIKLAFVDDDDAEDGEWKNAAPLRLEDFADYGAFARRLVELRRAGKPVLVRVERSPR